MIQIYIFFFFQNYILYDINILESTKIHQILWFNNNTNINYIEDINKWIIKKLKQERAIIRNNIKNNIYLISDLTIVIDKYNTKITYLSSLLKINKEILILMMKKILV